MNPVSFKNSYVFTNEFFQIFDVENVLLRLNGFWDSFTFS